MTMKRILRSAAAEAIRAHLWQPHPPGPLGGRPWTMGRELQIFDSLAHFVDPLELIGALAHVRAIANTKGPARLTWLIHPQRGPALLARALAAFHASEPTQTPHLAHRGPRRGGDLERIRVEIYDAMKDRAE